MDKCPDGKCGIDLGGAPARELMGEKAGRYSGEWTLAWAAEAENFFKVPTGVLQDTGSYDLEVVLPGDPGSAAGLKGTALAVAGSSFPLAARP